MSGENHIARIATPVSPVDKQVKIISVFHLSPNIFMLNPINKNIKIQPQLRRLRQDQFCPMECPILPLDTHLLSQDMIHDKVGANYCVNTTTSQGMSISNACHFSLIQNEVLCGEFKSSHSRRWKRSDGLHLVLRCSGMLFFSFLVPSSVVGLKTLESASC